jgi:hypothetical protein
MWITGQELCGRWRIDPAGLEEILKNNDLPMCSPSGEFFSSRELIFRRESQIVWSHVLKQPIRAQPALTNYRFNEQVIKAFESNCPWLTASVELSTHPQKPKDVARIYAKGRLAGQPGIERNALVDEIKMRFPEMPTDKTILDWIRDIFPDHSPLKPGRKKRKMSD